MRDDSRRVADMREAIEQIRSFVSRGRAAFFEDLRTHEAVAFEVLKLGEAASRVGSTLRRAHPEVPWSRLAALRNEIIHEYFRIDLDDLWEFVDSEMGDIERALREL